MSITFPANPNDGETLIYGSLRYTYFESKQVWKTTQVLNVPVITAVTTTTASLSNNQTATAQLTAYSGYMITGITVDNAAWVRVYSSSQGMANDAPRMMNTDPEASSGVGSEVIAYSPGTYTVTPGVYVANSDSPVTNNMYVRITNLGSSPAAITVTVNIIQIGV